MRRLILLVLTGVLLGTPAAAVPASPPSPAVTGYALGGASDALVAANAPGLSTLTVDGVLLRRGGGGVHAPGADLLHLVGTAHADGLRAELLVSNYSDELGDFDTAAAGRLLQDPAKIDKVADQLAGHVAAGGWDGVNVDLEALRRGDGPGLVSLLTQLRARLPAPLTLTVDVSAATSRAAYLRSGYRLDEIGAQVDAVQLMAYDLHGPTWSGPGPLGPLPWQRRALAALLEQVPASRVDLGVAGYGYTWPARRSGRTGRAVSVKKARALAASDGVTPRWHDGSGEWSARLDDGTRLRWSDGRSLELRRRLASDLGLRGIALWRLGSTDTLPPRA